MPSKIPEIMKFSENELIQAAKDGDDNAFEILAQSYNRIVEFHLKYFSLPESLKDDLYQEGMIGLMKAVRTYDGKSAAFTTYASLCIKRSMISGFRKYFSQNHPVTVQYEDFFKDQSTPSPEEEMLDKVRVKLLYDKVYGGLSEYEKMVFEMYLSDMSYESISFVTGKSVKSISNAVFRIRQKLKDIISV